MFVRAFMTLKFFAERAGSNDIYHHISATWQSGRNGAEAIPNNEGLTVDRDVDLSSDFSARRRM